MPLNSTAASVTENKVYEYEADLEADAVKFSKRRGWYSRKYKHAGRRAAPDREFIRKGIRFLVEFKRWPKEPTEQQWEEIRELLSVGVDVVWLSSIEDFRACLIAREGFK